jgi:tRNA (mo5U34)-methyltransferase
MSDQTIRQAINQTADRQREALEASGWWHSIDLGDGQVTPGAHELSELKENYARFGLPDDLAGKRVFDIGCWDGFYSFEAERHGAEVVAMDCWRPENFFLARQALNSKIEFHELSVYEVNRKRVGEFDIVFFLGVLYHLRHPLLALEQVCEVTREYAIVETHVVDRLIEAKHPLIEFYELDELGGQYDNWWGPNIECLTQMLRAAGFARVEPLRQTGTRATVKAYRYWEQAEVEPTPSLHIVDVVNAITFRHELPFQGRNAMIAISVEGLPPGATRDDVQVEVRAPRRRFGVNPYHVAPWGDPEKGHVQVNVPVPPGLEAESVSISVSYRGQISNRFEVKLSEGGRW